MLVFPSRPTFPLFTGYRPILERVKGYKLVSLKLTRVLDKDSSSIISKCITTYQTPPILSDSKHLFLLTRQEPSQAVVLDSVWSCLWAQPRVRRQGSLGAVSQQWAGPDGLFWDSWALFHQPELVWTAMATPQVRR